MPQLQLPFAQGGGRRQGETQLALRVTAAQGAAIPVPCTGRVCPQGCQGKASSKCLGQGSRIHPRSAVTKCPREGKRSSAQHRALLRAQPMPSSPRLKKRARLSPVQVRTAHGPESLAHAPPAGCARAASLPSAGGQSRALGPEPGDLTPCGDRWS